MSRLQILDLSFCDSELPNNIQVQGGVNITISSSTGAWSASSGSDVSRSYYTGYVIDKKTGNYGYVVSAKVDGALAGAVSGALGDGTKYASSYSSAQVL